MLREKLKNYHIILASGSPRRQQFFKDLDIAFTIELKDVKEVTNLPILRKDFIIDTYQIYESKFIGADCILLIASVLNDEQLREFSDLATVLELDYLIEVHDEKELARAEMFSNAIIGVNNRNLKTFDVDIQNSITNTWVRDVYSKNQFGIPNFMTGRVLNFKLAMKL